MKKLIPSVLAWCCAWGLGAGEPALSIWTADAGTAALSNGAVRLVVAAGQGQSLGALSGGGTTLYPGFLGCATLFPALDHDADGLCDEVDSDNDGDGLADLDELLGTRFPVATATDVNAADSDGDGASDGDEAVMASNPLDAQSLLRLTQIRSLTDGSVALAWQSQNGVTYAVDWGVSPRAAALTNALAGTFTASGGSGPWGDVETAAAVERPAASNAFFRVRIVP
jgi:hypothetical protein